MTHRSPRFQSLILTLVGLSLMNGALLPLARAQEEEPAEAPDVLLWVQDFPGFTTPQWAYQIINYPTLVVLSDGTILAAHRPDDLTSGHQMREGRLDRQTLALLREKMGDLIPMAPPPPPLPREGELHQIEPVMVDAASRQVHALVGEGYTRRAAIAYLQAGQIIEGTGLAGDARARAEREQRFYLLVDRLAAHAHQSHIPKQISVQARPETRQLQEPPPAWPQDVLPADRVLNTSVGHILLDDPEVIKTFVERIRPGTVYQHGNRVFEVLWHPILPVKSPGDGGGGGVQRR